MQIIVTATCVVVYAVATFALLRFASLSALAVAGACLNSFMLVLALGAGFVVGRGSVLPVQVSRFPTPKSRQKSKVKAEQDAQQVVYMLLDDNDEADARLFDGWMK